MLETFVRVRAFVAAHPVTGPMSYGSAPETLDEVVPRGRSAIDRLDAVVRAALDDDVETLAKWRAAKRVHQLSGPSASRGTDADEVPQAA